jgi:probable rRNA maturation factor
MSDPEDPGGAGDRLFVVGLADEQAVPVDRSALARLAHHALAALHVPAGAELSIVLVDGERMAELKGRWLGEAVPTDVLAFPMDGSDGSGGGPVMLGDVVVCPAVAERQATSSTADELNLLLVHGILHLLGRDHADADEKAAMWAEQDRILASFAGAAR